MKKLVKKFRESLTQHTHNLLWKGQKSFVHVDTFSIFGNFSYNLSISAAENGPQKVIKSCSVLP